MLKDFLYEACKALATNVLDIILLFGIHRGEGQIRTFIQNYPLKNIITHRVRSFGQPGPYQTEVLGV